MKSATYRLSLLILGLSLVPGSEAARGAEHIKLAMTPDHWTTEGAAEFVQHDGVAALQLNPGNRDAHIMTGQAVLKDFSFRNGTIEYDVEALGSMGAGMGFRRRDKDTYEDFYLRPRPNCSEAPDCVQYAPQTHGVLLWDLFPQYQGPASLREGQWNHIRVVVSGQRMNVFINGAKSPSLKIGRLEGDALEGGLLLQGPGVFANLTVTPDAVDGLPAEPEKDATAGDGRYVRNWQLSPFSTLPADKEPSLTDLPSSSAAWLSITAERSGLVNVSRQYGLPLPRPDRAVAWLKTRITSDKIQSKKVNFGWSREVWVFVNGERVFADKNLYQPPAARKMPDGRCSVENGSFDLPLKAGDNEITVALANDFYGWALILRFADVDGIQLAKK